eukprot:GGOE01018868.1.p2 GENE.GGOE01018868.1~~GGOE01018868.1.p2  ORF type:complete len:151 (-),score=57.57 GGOE01018868.1:263-715(-)
MAFSSAFDLEMPTHVNGLPLEDVYKGINEFAKMLQEDDSHRIRDVLMAHPALSVAMLVVLQQAGVLRNAKMELIPHPFHDAAAEDTRAPEDPESAALKRELMEQLAQISPDQLRELMALTPQQLEALPPEDRQHILMIQRELTALAAQQL